MTRRRTYQLIVVVLAAGLLAGVTAGWRWWHNRPPYGPEALSLTASLELVSNEQARAALGDAVNAPYASKDDQLVLGTVSWDPPPKRLDGGWFALVLVDKQAALKPPVISVASPRLDAVGSGNDGVMNAAAEEYPWLAGAGGKYVDGTWYSGGNMVFVFAEAATPLTFVALFPHFDPVRPPHDAVATAPVEVADLLLAMVYIGPDRQVYWASRIIG